MMISLLDKVKKIVEKGENAGYQHFFPLPAMFSKVQSTTVDNSSCVVNDQYTAHTPGKSFLTLSQTTNLKLFQTEIYCRRQFQI